MTDKAPSKSDQVRGLREARADRCAEPIPKRKNQRQAEGSAQQASPAGLSRLRAGRTAQDRGKLARPAAVAIQKRGPGRPKIDGKRPWEIAGMSKRSWYRRKAEGKL